jgi:hypothetical protein
MVKNRLSGWYTKGHIQKIITFLIFFTAAVILASLLEYICQGYVLGPADPILAQYMPPEDVLKVKLLLKAASDGFWPHLFMSLVFTGGLLWALVKITTRFNLVGQIVLDKALRFTDAMENLGLKHDWEQFHFVRHYDLPVYIAAKPLLAAESSAVKASFYPYIQTLLASPSSLDEYKGSKRLCLKAADLDEALNKLQATTCLPEPETQAAAPPLRDIQTRVADLEMRNKVLQNQLVESGAKIKELESVNESCKSELQGYALREGKDDKAQKRLMLYSLALAPIFHKLVAKKPDRRDLTKPALAALFKISVEGRPTLKSLLVGLGEAEPTDLPDNFCDLLWENLKTLDLTSLGGPPPTGNLARLKKIVFDSG